MRDPRSSSRPAIWIACALGALAASCTEPPPADTPRRAVALHGDEPSLGRQDAAVEVVVWGDLGATPTARVLSQVIELARDPLSDVKVVWKALPASTHGLTLARTAMAAAEQDRFWEYVVATATASDDPGEAAGLDPDAVAEALESGRVDELVKRDLADGRILGIARTPMLWINGREVAGAPSGERLTALLREEVARAGWLLAIGFPRDRLDADLFEVAPRVRFAPRLVVSSALIAARPTDEDTSTAPAAGPASAVVELVVVGDYGCAFSHAAFDLGRAVRDAFPGQVRLKWVRRADPGRPDRQLAANAAAAAAAQGAFWRMHYALLDYRGTFTRPEIERLAEASGLDVEALGRALDAAPSVDLTPAAAPAASPAFIVNGLQLDGLVTADTLWSLVAIQRARATDHALVSTL